MCVSVEPSPLPASVEEMLLQEEVEQGDGEWCGPLVITDMRCLLGLLGAAEVGDSKVIRCCLNT